MSSVIFRGMPFIGEKNTQASENFQEGINLTELFQNSTIVYRTFSFLTPQERAACSLVSKAFSTLPRKNSEHKVSQIYLNFPHGIHTTIFSFLNYSDFVSCALVSKRMREEVDKAFQAKAVWEIKNCEKSLNSGHYSPEKTKKMRNKLENVRDFSRKLTLTLQNGDKIIDKIETNPKSRNNRVIRAKILVKGVRQFSLMRPINTLEKVLNFEHSLRYPAYKLHGTKSIYSLEAALLHASIDISGSCVCRASSTKSRLRVIPSKESSKTKALELSKKQKRSFVPTLKNILWKRGILANSSSSLANKRDMIFLGILEAVMQFDSATFETLLNFAKSRHLAFTHDQLATLRLHICMSRKLIFFELYEKYVDLHLLQVSGLRSKHVSKEDKLREDMRLWIHASLKTDDLAFFKIFCHKRTTMDQHSLNSNRNIRAVHDFKEYFEQALRSYSVTTLLHISMKLTDEEIKQVFLKEENQEKAFLLFKEEFSFLRQFLLLDGLLDINSFKILINHCISHGKKKQLIYLKEKGIIDLLDNDFLQEKIKEAPVGLQEYLQPKNRELSPTEAE